MMTASDVLADCFARRAKHWGRASFFSGVVLMFSGFWPVPWCWVAFALGALGAWGFHRLSMREYDRARAVMDARIAALRVELRAMGIDPDE